MNLSRSGSRQKSTDGPLFEEIPEYEQIISDLSRGNLKADFGLEARKSKLSYSLQDILFDEGNDELSYFVLYMDSLGASNYVKFLLDLKNFESVIDKKDKLESMQSFNQIVAQDALSIFAKYITQDAVNTINLPSEIIEHIIHSMCPEDRSGIDLNCFAAGKNHVYSMIQDEFYDKYLLNEYHCKYILSSLENRFLNLSDLLYDDIAVVYFLEYLEQENKSDLLKFWIQAENFSRNILNFSQNYDMNNSSRSYTVESLYSQWQADAIIIYDNFISLQAKNPLGFDQCARQSVESNICFQSVEREDLESFISSYANSFYVPMLIVFSILQRVYFNKFLDSSLYANYIKEIKLSSNILIRKSSVESNAKQAAKKKSLESGPLWTRPQSGNLQFGKVDPSGRYIGYDGSINGRSDLTSRIFSDITNDYDDAWSIEEENGTTKTSSAKILEKKIKLKLEKLINMMPLNGRTSSYSKTSNEDLEIAEQMAEMLVKEVAADNQLI